MIHSIKFLDKRIGNIICNFLGLFNRGRHHGETKKILAVQLWGIGETILTLPAIEALRKKFPNAEIDVLATSRNKNVYCNNKNVGRVIQISLNPFSVLKFIIKNVKKYDVAIDMEEYLSISAIISFFAGKRAVGYSHGSRAKLYTDKVKYNDKQHAVQTFLDLAGVLDIRYNVSQLPRLNYSKNDKNFVDKFLRNNKIKKNDFVVCVAPGAAESAKSRMWPYERYAELCDEIIERHKARIIFVGAYNEVELIEAYRRKWRTRQLMQGGKFP